MSVFSMKKQIIIVDDRRTRDQAILPKGVTNVNQLSMLSVPATVPSASAAAAAAVAAKLKALGDPVAEDSNEDAVSGADLPDAKAAAVGFSLLPNPEAEDVQPAAAVALNQQSLVVRSTTVPAPALVIPKLSGSVEQHARSAGGAGGSSVTSPGSVDMDLEDECDARYSSSRPTQSSSEEPQSQIEVILRFARSLASRLTHSWYSLAWSP